MRKVLLVVLLACLVLPAGAWAEADPTPIDQWTCAAQYRELAGSTTAIRGAMGKHLELAVGLMRSSEVLDRQRGFGIAVEVMLAAS
ncbi:MAG: hypothetical protein ACYC08_10360, partial [Armatimonadota bacterium]